MNYVMLRNLYANERRWGNVEDIKALMRRKGTKKEVGCSFIEVNSRVWEFLAGDTVHPQLEAIQSILGKLLMHMEGEESTGARNCY